MKVKFKYEDIFSRCEQLSSFEARGKVDANGGSRYLDIHINDIDKLLIDQYIKQAVINLQEAFGRMIVTTIPNAGLVIKPTEALTEEGEQEIPDDEVIEDDLTSQPDEEVGEEQHPQFEKIEGFTWVIRNDTRWNGLKAFSKHVTEAIVSYVLAQWLSDKLPERVQFYESLFTSSLAMASKNLFTKQAPKKK